MHDMKECLEPPEQGRGKLTSKAVAASLSMQIMAWSEVALQERTICSNLPSTGTAVLTTGGNTPHLHSTINC